MSTQHFRQKFELFILWVRTTLCFPTPVYTNSTLTAEIKRERSRISKAVHNDRERMETVERQLRQENEHYE